MTTRPRKIRCVGRSGPAHRAQEDRVHAFQHERAVEHGERQHGEGGDGGEQQKGAVVERQHRAEEHVQQVHVRALQDTMVTPSARDSR
jgi:hypothetical protein